MSYNKAVFLDRDGTLNEEKEYLHKWEDFEWLPTVREGLVKLKQAGYLLIVVSNQSGIARGYYTCADVDELHKKINKDLWQKDNILLDSFYYCPHHPDISAICSCRKPASGMILEAMEKYQIDPRQSWLIGDKKIDVEAGLNAGVQPILVLTGYGKEQMKQISPFIPVCANFLTAVNHIINQP